MYPFFFDRTMLLLLPALLLAMWAQFRVKSAYSRFGAIPSRRGVTAAQVARSLLDRFGLSNVPVGRVPGNLTDHYDPRDKSLSLSDTVYNSTSIAAIGVAAHEVGHAIQDKERYAPLAIRNAIVPVVGIGSSMAIPLFFIGLFLRGEFLVNLGIVLFLGVIVFHVVTLPVEFDAKYFGAGAGVAIRKEDTALRDALDAGIKAIRDNGKWKELSEKHVPGVDIWGS